MSIWEIVILLVMLAVVVGLVRAVKKLKAQGAQLASRHKERMEALFRATFPELQPHFHPARVYEFVKLRRGQKAPTGPTQWRKPAGFPAAEVADLNPDGLEDRVRLLDAAGATIAEFVYEEHPDGGVIRYGKGKFTANVNGPEPRVRYWHPQREFKWTPSAWKISSGIADSPLSSSDGSSSFDGPASSSSSSSTAYATAAGAAAGAAIVAAGGTFDGGGASESWDGGGASGGSAASDRADTTAASTAY